jgi:hypothetical protein
MPIAFAISFLSRSSKNFSPSWSELSGITKERISPIHKAKFLRPSSLSGASPLLIPVSTVQAVSPPRKAGTARKQLRVFSLQICLFSEICVLTGANSLIIDNKLPRSKPALSADRLTRYSDVTSEKFVSLPAGRQVCCLLSDVHRTFRQVEIKKPPFREVVLVNIL